MKKNILSLTLLVFWSNLLLGQVSNFQKFNGDLTNSFTLNDPNGSNVGGGITLTDGIQLNNVVGGREARVFKNIGLLDDNSFSANCNVSLTNGNSPGHFIMAFTAGIQDVLANVGGIQCSNVDISTSNCIYTNTNQSAIEVLLFNPDVGFYSNILSEGTAISVFTKVGNSAHVLASSPIYIPANSISNFNVQFIRTSLTSGTIICSNNNGEIGRSSVIIPSSITNLNTIQSGVNTSANNARTLSGKINNIIINNCVNLPTPTIESSQICEGNSSTLIASTTFPNSQFSWYEQENSSTVISNSNVYTTPTLYANSTYYVSYSTISGNCKSSRIPVNVIVNPKPIVKSITNNDSIFCIGKTVKLNCETMKGIWLSSDNKIATIDTFGNLKVLSQGIVNISYYVSSGYCNNSVSKTLSLGNSIPQLSIIGSSEVCPNSSVNFNIYPKLNNTKYYWSADEEIKLSYKNFESSEVLALIPDSQNSQYRLKAIAVNSCGNIAETSLTISIKPDLPNKPKLVCSSNDNCSVLSLQSEPSNGEAVTWYNGDKVIKNVSSFVRNIDENIYVTFSKNGCSNSDIYHSQVCIDGTQTVTNVSNQENINNYQIYPNPNNGIFRFKSNVGVGKAFVINSMGAVLFDISLDESKIYYDVNLSNLSPGIYILKVDEINGSIFNTFIVK